MTEEALRVLGADQLEALVRAVREAEETGIPCSVEVEIQVCNGKRPVLWIAQRTRPKRVAG